MKQHTVCIVGQEGTTGLRIHERLAHRNDIRLVCTAKEDRKDLKAIRKAAEQADLLFLCLPDQASRDVVEAAADFSCKIIDASAAFRTAPEWAYGFPELSPSYREQIAASRYIANPGCHASGAAAILYPLVCSGIVPADYPFQITSLTGYSGGGKKMIAQYEAADRPEALASPRQYGLGQTHKHLKEIVRHCQLGAAPIFLPIVAPYYSGMEVSIGFHTRCLPGNLGTEQIYEALAAYYEGQRLINVMPLAAEEICEGFLPANRLAGTDRMQIYVSGNEERTIVHAVFDNLGKGASGAAVQCMNIAFGLPEDTGLVL